MPQYVRGPDGRFRGSRPSPAPAPVVNAPVVPIVVSRAAGQDLASSYARAYDAFASARTASGVPVRRPLARRWAGALQEGYNPEDLYDFFTHVEERTGVSVACVWPEVGSSGVAGEPEWVVIQPGGRVHQLEGNLWAWACLPDTDPNRPASPGGPKAWIGEEVGNVSKLFRVDAWNFARAEHSDG